MLELRDYKTDGVADVRVAMRGQDGKLRWQPLITSTSGTGCNGWSSQVIDSPLAPFPDKLDAVS